VFSHPGTPGEGYFWDSYEVAKDLLHDDQNISTGASLTTNGLLPGSASSTIAACDTSIVHGIDLSGGVNSVHESESSLGEPLVEGDSSSNSAPDTLNSIHTSTPVTQAHETDLGVSCSSELSVCVPENNIHVDSPSPGAGDSRGNWPSFPENDFLGFTADSISKTRASTCRELLHKSHGRPSLSPVREQVRQCREQLAEARRSSRARIVGM